tara:strand:+ start:41 stop:2209 length:2169 start_codon:yes stop_codon:yes gene_type:complete
MPRYELNSDEYKKAIKDKTLTKDDVILLKRGKERAPSTQIELKAIRDYELNLQGLKVTPIEPVKKEEPVKPAVEPAVEPEERKRVKKKKEKPEEPKKKEKPTEESEEEVKDFSWKLHLPPPTDEKVEQVLRKKIQKVKEKDYKSEKKKEDALEMRTKELDYFLRVIKGKVSYQSIYDGTDGLQRNVKTDGDYPMVSGIIKDLMKVKPKIYPIPKMNPDLVKLGPNVKYGQYLEGVFTQDIPEKILNQIYNPRNQNDILYEKKDLLPKGSVLGHGYSSFDYGPTIYRNGLVKKSQTQVYYDKKTNTSTFSQEVKYIDDNGNLKKVYFKLDPSETDIENNDEIMIINKDGQDITELIVSEFNYNYEEEWEDLNSKAEMLEDLMNEIPKSESQDFYEELMRDKINDLDKEIEYAVRDVKYYDGLTRKEEEKYSPAGQIPGRKRKLEKAKKMKKEFLKKSKKEQILGWLAELSHKVFRFTLLYDFSSKFLEDRKDSLKSDIIEQKNLIIPILSKYPKLEQKAKERLDNLKTQLKENKTRTETIERKFKIIEKKAKEETTLSRVEEEDEEESEDEERDEEPVEDKYKIVVQEMLALFKDEDEDVFEMDKDELELILNMFLEKFSTKMLIKVSELMKTSDFPKGPYDEEDRISMIYALIKDVFEDENLSQLLLFKPEDKDKWMKLTPEDIEEYFEGEREDLNELFGSGKKSTGEMVCECQKLSVWDWF